MTKKQRKSGKKKTSAFVDNGFEKQPAVLAHIKGSLDDTASVEHIKHDEEQEDYSVKKKKSHFIIGLFVLIMAAVGIISSISAISKAIGSLADDASFKNELAKYVFPLVVNDAPAFDKIEDMPESAIISCAVWNILLNSDLSQYETEGDNVIIPKVDVEYNINKLFGSLAKYEHQTVGDLFLQFEYIPEKNSYSAPKKPRYMLYSPYIDSVEVVGETYTVTVGYIPPSLVMLHEEVNTQPEAEKYMVFTISITNERKTIKALTYSEKNKELSLD